MSINNLLQPETPKCPSNSSSDLKCHKDWQRSFHSSTSDLLIWRKQIYIRYANASVTGPLTISSEDRNIYGNYTNPSVVEKIISLELQENVYRTVFDVHYDGIKALTITFYLKKKPAMVKMLHA